MARCSVGLLLRSGYCRGRSLDRRTGDRTLRAPVAGRLRAKKNHFLPLAAFRPQAPRAVAFRQCTCALAVMLPSSRCSNLSRPRSGWRLRRPLFLAAAPPGGSAVRLVPRRLSGCIGYASHPTGACTRTAGPTRLDTSSASAGEPAFRAYHLRPAVAGLGDGLPAGSRASGSRLIAQSSRDSSPVRGAPVRRRNSQGYAPVSLYPCSFFAVPLLRPAVSQGLRRPRLLAHPFCSAMTASFRHVGNKFLRSALSRRLSQNKAGPRR